MLWFTGLFKKPEGLLPSYKVQELFCLDILMSNLVAQWSFPAKSLFPGYALDS